MDIRELAFNLKTDHIVIKNLLEDIIQASVKDALKLLPVLRQLLLNHFIVEELLFYPLIRKKQVESYSKSIGLYGGDNGSGKDDLKQLKREIEKYESVGTKIISRISECTNLKRREFKSCIKPIAGLIKERIDFEENILLKPIDTSPERMSK